MNTLCGRGGSTSQQDAMNKLMTGCDNASMQHKTNKPNSDNNLQDDSERLLTGNKHMTSYHNWLCPESLCRIQITSNPNSRDIIATCDKLIETDEQIAKEVTEYMFDHDVLNIRRSELLHHRWTDRVYDPIRYHVLSEMSGRDYQNLLLYKRFLYEEFLAKTNRKECVSLDVMENADRNLLLSPTARFSQLNDPLLRPKHTRIEEDRIAMQCVTGEKWSSAAIERLHLPTPPLIPLGRQGTSCKQWVSMNVSDIESPVHQQSRRAKNPNRNHSNVAWDCYYRRCPDEPPPAPRPPASSPSASAVAAADVSCIEQREK